MNCQSEKESSLKSRGIEARETNGTVMRARLREQTEETAEMCDEYKKVLLDQLKGLVHVVTCLQVLVNNIYQHIAYCQNMLTQTQDDHISVAVKACCMALKGQVGATVQQIGHTSKW